MNGKRLLGLFLAALLLLCTASPALAAQKEEPSVSLRVTGEITLGERISLKTALSGFSDKEGLTYDYLVKKPGAVKYVYLKRGSSSSGLRYRPSAAGEYLFRVRVWEAGAKSYVSSSTVSAIVLPTAEGRWDPAENYAALPSEVSSMEEVVDAVNSAVVTYRLLPELKAYSLSSYWDGIGSREEPFHTAYLKGGRISFGARFQKKEPSDLSIELLYDAAGQLIRNYLYDEPLDGEESTAFFEKKIRTILDALDLASKESEYEKVLALHDYIVSTFRYDTAPLSKGVYAQESYTAMGMVDNGYAVCEGYAELFGVLAILSGLKCYIITGAMGGTNHMWNLVSVDGQWYHVDCTGDDPIPNVPGRVLRRYFLRSDQAMQSAGYRWDSRFFVSAPASYLA